ncbi:MAG: M6 family metalloprotease domain-containing protein [Muribaculaceae bacterium]|nr:M6 family metalloprotease domain-containing protein [Muribaculaceae bacterium]
MTFRKILLLGAAGLLTTLPSMAVRALESLRTVTQPDGTQLTVKRVGDERSHFLLTSDGYLLTEQDGLYTFATLDSRGRAVTTGVQAANAPARTQAQRAAAVRLDEESMRAAFKKRASAGKRAIPQNGMGRFTSNYPTRGDINALVILVEYKDVKFNLDDPAKYFDALLHEEGFSQYGGTGCVVEYFRENSLGQFNPHFDLLGPVTLPNTRKYYGGNDSWGNDRNPQDMVVDAVKMLDPLVDFSKYDNDGDGVLDNVFIFYAGQGEASYGPADSVWPHSWDLESAGVSFKADGVLVNSYACTNEWEQSRPDGVGTFIHEYSHVIGLPDLYDTQGELLCTPGPWSVLDYGPYNNDGCTPPNYSIYERNAMGWMEPAVLDAPATVTLEPIHTSNSGCLIPTSRTNEFFLLENRQREGWDKYLPGHGMLIWHVDFVPSVWDNNSLNVSSSHQYVEMMKANNVFSTESESVLAGWAWPGTSRATEFTSSSKPALKTWSGEYPDMPITGITEQGGLISFFAKGGEAPIDVPEVIWPLNVGVDWFEAAWNPVEGATDYLLTVFCVTAGAGEETHTADMGSGKAFRLPEGWTSSTTDNYSTTGNYGEASPSYKLGRDGAWLRTPDFDGDVKEVSFWYKSQQSDGSTLKIEGVRANGSTVILDQFVPQKNAKGEYTVSGIPAGIRAILFTYSKATGNLALDDVKVVTGGDGMEIVNGFDNVSTGGRTSMLVEGLDPSAKQYGYFVKATDGKFITPASETMEVELSSTSVEGIEGVSGILPLRLDGRALSTADGSFFSVSDISGRIVCRQTSRTILPAAGVYLVSGTGKTVKVIVR